METHQAVNALSALAHPGRLAAFRLLVAEGSSGLPAGEIGRRLGVAPSTLSASLGILSAAGLVASERRGRSIIYLAAITEMARLLDFLASDCCGGRPELCAPLQQMQSRMLLAPHMRPAP